MWKPGASIRRGVPLVICGLLAVVIGVYAFASYRAVRHTVITESRTRLVRSVDQLQRLLSRQSAETREGVAELADSSALVGALAVDGAPDTLELQRALATTVTSEAVVGSSVLDGDGRVLTTLGTAPIASAARGDAAHHNGWIDQLATPTTGPIRVVDGRPVFPVAARLADDGRTVGYLVVWYRLAASPQSRRVIEELIGDDARFYLGNADGGLWTDLIDRVPAPASEPVVDGTLDYERPGAGRFLAAAAAIPGTDWAVLVESPLAAALAPARATLRLLLPVGLLVLALGTALAWALGGRLTRGVAELASAAESISRGEYGRQVRVARSDEIGALGRAFNTMSAAVAEARGALEGKVDQLARSEARHRETRERLQHVVSSSAAVLYSLRPHEDGIALAWISDNVRERLGYTVEEAMRPEWWRDNVHPEDREMLFSGDQPDLPTADRGREYRFRHGDGHYRWLRDDERVLRDTDGRMTEVIGALSDISERRELEEQFRNSQKLEAVGRLAGGVAHDFNNLLTVILGEVDVARAAARTDGPGAEALDSVQHAATRAAELTRQLLTFSRQDPIAASAFDPNTVVRELHNMLRRVIGEDMALELDLMEPVSAVFADRGQIEQVLLNLVVNARDATPAGGTITIQTDEVALDLDAAAAHGQLTTGEFVVISVSDTGTGMSDEVKRHLFEPFFTTKPTGEGTGLGLATCYAIVDRFGGHLTVYSELEVGTTVRVYLPRTEEAATTPAPGRDPGAPRGKETILVAEDDDAVRSVTTRILAAQGYEVLAAEDGAEALAILENDPGRIDLLLTDVVMPRMGGRALSEAARKLRPDLPILFASGYSDDFIIQNQVFDRHMTLVQKPFTRDNLATRVREALDRPA